MAGFDPKAYEDSVLKPLRRLMPHLPKDLARRYAIEPAMDDAALRERVDAVLRLWNKQAMRQGPLGVVAKQLIREHAEYTAGGQDPTTAEFWRTWTAQRSREVGGAIDALAAELRTTYGTMKVITRAQLRAEAATRRDLGDAELDQACRQAGLEVVEPVELPTAARLRGQVRTLNEAIKATRAVSIPELLFPDLTSFGLLGALSVNPVPPGRTVTLTVEAAAERMLELDKLPDNEEVRDQRQALGFLATEAKAGTDLLELALFHVLQPVREMQAEGVQAPRLYELLVRSKVRPADAGRIVVSLLSQGTVRPNPGDAVLQLLAEGLLVAAQQAATAIQGADGDAARAAVAQRRDDVNDMRAKANEHVRAGRDEEAGTLLREALGLASDLPGLAEELAGVPTAPVLSAYAQPDADGVRITWQSAPVHGSATVIVVVRGNGRAPDAPDDGAQISVKGGHATDPAPPVGAAVHYGVFAREDGRRSSRPVGATVQVVPPVANLVIEGGPGEVTGSWRAHPAVAAVEVRRTAGNPDGPGEPIAVQGFRSFRDTAVTHGTQYYYRLVAVYPSATGGPALRSVAVVGRGAVRLEAKPVTSLTATPVGGTAPTLRLSWRQQLGNEVVIRRSLHPCPWEYGARVGAAELASFGTELDGRLTARGVSMSLVIAAPPGRSWLVPFTVDADGSGLRGQDAKVELISPVQRIHAHRFGDDIRLTWLWPAEVSAADVVWPGGKRRITQQQYREEGGCLLRSVPAVRRVEVSSVTFGLGEEGRSPAASVEVEGRPVRVDYELRRRGSRFAGGVKCTVTLSSAEAIRDATVVLVASAGPVMPLTPGAPECVELLREPVTLEPGVPWVLPEVAVPNSLRKPYWLRCFLADPAPALLVDPPVTQLKVS